MKKAKNRIFSLFIVICIMVVIQPGYVQASGNYTADWQRWSQGASGYSAMQWGCRVTAYSKMLAEAGYTGFGNPDGFFEWGKEMGYFRASDTCELTSIGTAPVTYVNNTGGTASLVGSQALSGNKTADANTIMNLIRQGYYVVLTCSAHTAYVGRGASLNQGTAVLLDSWASAKEGSSLQYRNYTLYTFQTAYYFRITPVQLWCISENETFSGQVRLWAKRGDRDPNHYAIWYMDDVPLTGHTSSDNSGFFSVNIDTTKYSNGTHQLSIYYVNSGAGYWDVRHINISNPILLWGISENDTFSGQVQLRAKRGDSDSNHYAIWYMDDVPFTGHTSSDSNGFFTVNMDTTKYSNGTHQLSIYYVNSGAGYWDVRHININNDVHTHSYYSSVTRQPTCTQTGLKTFICSICNDSYTEDIPEIDHITEIRNAVPATATEEGYTGDTYCTRCGQKMKDGTKIEKLKADISESGNDSNNGSGSSSNNGENEAGNIYPAKDSVYTVEGVYYKVKEADEHGGKVEITFAENRSAETIIIPGTVTIDGCSFKVTGIASDAFKGCKKLKTVKLGKNVAVIGDKAFYNCTSLTTVTASKVTKIGNSAFYGCKKLKTVKGFDGVVSVGNKAFYKCEKLTTVGSKNKVVTLKNVKTIGNSAFYGCKSVKKVNLTSASLTKIGASAFRDCTSMTGFTSKSKKLTSIGKKAFYGDRKLATVTLKTEKLKKSKVRANAFKGVRSSCKFKVGKW